MKKSNKSLSYCDAKTLGTQVAILLCLFGGRFCIFFTSWPTARPF